MAELPPTRKRLLDFIQAEAHAGRPIPTLREIAAKLGFRGHRAAAFHLDALRRDGFIESDSGKARSLRVTSPLAKLRSRIVDIPFYGSIPAGFADDREQEPDGCITVDVASIGFKPTRNTFALRVVGDSMIGKFICDGDIAVFEHGPEPRPGQIVAALIDRKNTLKTFLVKNGKPFLKAENPKYPNLIPSEELVIQGVFRALNREVSDYVPLRVHSHYSFLDSTLSPTAIVESAKRHGLSAVALTDTGNLHGAVEFVQAAKQHGVKPILGTELRVGDKPLLLYVESARGYHNLCRLLSRHAERTATDSDEASVANQQRRPFRRGEFDGLTDGLIAVGEDEQIAEMFPHRFYHLAASREAASSFPIAACPSIHYATTDDRQKYDIVQSIRTLTLLRQQHPEKRNEGRLHFRSPAEMVTACKEHSDWLRHTHEIAERCNFDLPFGKPQFPAFTPPDGSPPHEFLRRLVLQGLRERYGARAGKFQPQAMEELGIISEVGYEEYFLITWDFLQECRRRGIEWITRGSAADSLVCYCLGISSVCPIRFDLYFRRFLNKERMALNKLPDIDIDFAHDLKDDVVKLIFEKYGREHCAVVGGFSTFQARSAFAEVAKVLGVAEREVRKFTDHFPWSFGGGWIPDEPTPSGGAGLIEMLRASPENRDLPLDEEPYRTALQMAEFLDGVPRYPKMHPCGVVLSRQPMHELTPTFIANKGYATTHFDMDAVETVGLVKMDILAQGGLAAMRDVKAMLAGRGIEVDLERCIARDKSDGRLLLGDPQAREPWLDSEVWEMIASGNGRAVHHIESPAMTSLCRMSNVHEIDGLIAIVSVIRPGAANEGKKLGFTRRYQGLEPVSYPHPSLEPCLRSTYGLVVYEEHILQLCEAFAGSDVPETTRYWALLLLILLEQRRHREYCVTITEKTAPSFTGEDHQECARGLLETLKLPGQFV